MISPSLKCSYLKTPWDIMGVVKVSKRIVREVIARIFVRNKSGNKNYLVKDE